VSGVRDGQWQLLDSTGLGGHLTWDCFLALPGKARGPAACLR